MIVEKSVKDRLELIPKGGYARYVKVRVDLNAWAV